MARKRVAVYSTSSTFVAALRLVLPECEVARVAHMDDVESDWDGLVVHAESAPNWDEVRTAATSTPTLILAGDEHVISAVEADCRGFLSRESPLDEVSDAVRAILEGGAVVQPDLLGTLLRHLVDRRRARANSSELDTLTKRENEVFQLAALGARKEEIGEALFISPATARTHLQRVYRKLAIHSQAELVAYAARTGNLEQEEI